MPRFVHQRTIEPAGVERAVAEAPVDRRNTKHRIDIARPSIGLHEAGGSLVEPAGDRAQAEP